MKVLVAGANGNTGRLLLPRLAAAGHAPYAMVRRAEQGEALGALGADTIVHADLETSNLEAAVSGVHAVVFAAGSGSATGVDRTISVDLMGAIRLITACETHGPDRFVMLSSMGTRDPHEGRESMRHYYTAKAEADAWLTDSALAWTIVRPGRLSLDEPTGRVALAPELDRGDPLPRADLADVLVACLDTPGTLRRTFEVTAGETSIADALGALTGKG